MMDTRAFYDRISGAYDFIADTSESVCRDRGLQALNVSIGERVLELGFGTGHAIQTLASSVGPAGRVSGVDISAGMLAVARRRVEPAGMRNVVLAIDDARSLCFRNAVENDQVAQFFSIAGTHLGDFMGPPATGRRFDCHISALFTLRGDQMRFERRVSDFTGLLVQVGVLKARPA